MASENPILLTFRESSHFHTARAISGRNTNQPAIGRVIRGTANPKRLAEAQASAAIARLARQSLGRSRSSDPLDHHGAHIQPSAARFEPGGTSCPSLLPGLPDIDPQNGNSPRNNWLYG